MPSSSDAKPVKSRFLAAIFDQREAELTKKLARHLQDLLTGIDASTRAACMANLGEARECQTSLEMDALIKSISSGDDKQRAKVEHSLSVLGFLVDALLNEEIPEGDYKQWAEDFETIGWLDNPSRRVLDSVLSELNDKYLDVLRVKQRRRVAKAGVLPGFQSLGITVEARSVRKNLYKWGMPLDGENGYRPEIIGTTMVASVHVGVDEGSPRDFYFQMDETDIDKFVGSLVAAKKEMAALRRYLDLDTEGKARCNG